MKRFDIRKTVLSIFQHPTSLFSFQKLVGIEFIWKLVVSCLITGSMLSGWRIESKGEMVLLANGYLITESMRKNGTIVVLFDEKTLCYC